MKNILTLTFSALLLSGSLLAQNVGVGTPTPVTKLNVVQVAAVPGIEVDHAGATGNSIIAFPQDPANASSVTWIINQSAGRGINVDMALATSTTPGIEVDQDGEGDGIFITHDNTAGAAGTGIFIDQNGVDPFSRGMEIQMDAANSAAGAGVFHSGTGFGQILSMTNTGAAGTALFINQDGTDAFSRGIEIQMDPASIAAGSGIFHDGVGIGQLINMSDATNNFGGLRVAHSGTAYGVEIVHNGTNGGVLNVLNSAATGMLNNQTAAGGTGVATFMNGQPGTGYFLDSIADGFGVNVTVNTVTPTVANIISGATFAGTQQGVGHGILMNHNGAQGRGAEFNIQNAANPDYSIFATHDGSQTVIRAESQPTAPVGQINVAEFSYTGTHNFQDHVAVSGNSTPAAGWGVGVEGTGNWYGVFSNGELGASGIKSFLIDHPLDPENKFLRHASIESPEVLNLYRGNAQLDANGQAIVELPSYFEAVNKNFSYQLTPIGTAQQPYIANEIEGNTFVIAGAANTKVSWTVYAERNDPYMQQKPELRTAEVKKEGGRKGKYLTPELYGQPSSKAIFPHSKASTATSNINTEKPELPTLEATNGRNNLTQKQDLNQAKYQEEDMSGKLQEEPNYQEIIEKGRVEK